MLLCRHERFLLDRNWPLSIVHLHETVFGVDGVFNYNVELRLVKGADHLILMIDTREAEDFPSVAERIQRAVVSLPAVRTARATGTLAVDIRPVQDRLAVSSGASKRHIQDLRERNA